MVKNAWISLVALLFGLSLVAPAFAGEGKAGGPATGPAKPAVPAEKAGAVKEAKGKVVSVDASRKTLIVEAGEKRMVFAVAEPALKNLATIKNGDQVTVRYTEDGGKFMAQEVTKS